MTFGVLLFSKKFIFNAVSYSTNYLCYQYLLFNNSSVFDNSSQSVPNLLLLHIKHQLENTCQHNDVYSPPVKFKFDILLYNYFTVTDTTASTLTQLSMETVRYMILKIF